MLENTPREPQTGSRPKLATARRELGGRPPQSIHNGSSEPENVSPLATAQLAQTREPPRLDLWIVLTYFIASFGAQLLLLIPQVAPLRIPLRITPFALSMALAVLMPKHRPHWLRLHPSVPLALIACCIVAFGLLNQETDSLLAGAAQIALTLAILAPLIWVGRLQLDVRGFETIVLFLWGFASLSAGVGVLQVVFPGHFQVATSTIVQQNEENGITYNIELADGTETTRPYGLTDQPGGAAAAGLTAFLFGLGLLASSKNMLMRGVYLAGMGVGLFVMYLSQVRVSIVMCGIGTIAFVIMMVIRGEATRLTGALVSLAIVIFVSTFAAFTVGGSQTRDRLFSLTEDSAGNVYYSNRGQFLDYTFNYVLPTYPLGAGLGRHGMMSRYFSQDLNGTRSLWAEIQWTAWAYDGGWLMVICYPLAILLALKLSFDVSRKSAFGPMGLWTAIMTSYNIAVIAVLFSYPFFESQAGLEWWILNAAMFAAAQFYLHATTPDVPQGFEVLPAPWRPTLAITPGADSPARSARRHPLGQKARPAIIPVFGPVESTERPT